MFLLRRPPSFRQRQLCVGPGACRFFAVTCTLPPAVFPLSPAACRPRRLLRVPPVYTDARRLSDIACRVSAPAPAALSPSPALCRLPLFRRQQPAVFCPWRLPLFSPSAACRLSPPVSAPSRRRLPAVFLTRRCVCRFSAASSLACVGPGACCFPAVTCPKGLVRPPLF